MSKRNEVKVDAFKAGHLVPARAIIIGTRPKSLPYINIETPEGQMLVSIGDQEMNRLVKKWVKAWGGYPT